MTMPRTDSLSPQQTGAEQEKAVGRKSNVLSKLYGRADKAEKFASRRDANSGTKSVVVISSNVKRRRKPKVYQQNIGYDFLQYMRIIYKWALANHDISRGELDLLLYLNPIGVFGKSDFDFFHRTVALYQRKALQKLINDGWIVVWRDRRSDEKALYTLSNKAKTLCNRMHKMCVGEEKIPETVNNNLVTDKTKVINKYYLNVIKSMNKRKAPTE